MKKLLTAFAAFCCFVLPGCSGHKIDYYAARKPKVDLRDFFTGEVEGWGALFDFRGRQTRRFYVAIEGYWDKQQSKQVLHEQFEFDDGEKVKRTWDVFFKNNEMFVAKAADVVGEAHGKQTGNAVNMRYTLQVPYSGSTLNVSMDDWMYQVADRIILNRTAMKKFGFMVGEVMLIMQKK